MYILKQVDPWDPVSYLPLREFFSENLMPHKSVSKEYVRNIINNATLDKPFIIFDLELLVKYCSIRKERIVFKSYLNITQKVMAKTIIQLIDKRLDYFMTECIKSSEIKPGETVFNRFGFKFIVHYDESY